VIGDYLAQEIWCCARTGVDGYGQPTFGDPAKLAGRWLEKRRLVRNAEGEQVISEVFPRIGRRGGSETSLPIGKEEDVNWKLTLAKGLVVGALAALGVWAADIHAVSAWWAGAAVLAIEAVRDLLKSRFGSFVPSG